MSWQKILQSYALSKTPDSIPPTIRLSHNERVIAIFDGYAKAKYHFLLLPRPSGLKWNSNSLGSLRSVLRAKKEDSKELLLMLKLESEPIVKMIEDEMVSLNMS